MSPRQPRILASFASRPPEVKFTVAAVTTGLLVWFFTIRTYRFTEQSSKASTSFFSNMDADHRIDQAKSHLSSNPEDMEAWMSLGVAFYQKGKTFYPEGLNALKQATNLGALSPKIFYYNALMYEGMGLFDHAIDQFQKYLRHYPNDYESTVRLGNMYVLTKQPELAIQKYREGLKHWPKDPTSWLNYAVALKLKGEYDEAHDALIRFRKLYDSSSPSGASFEEGEIYRLQNKPAQAIGAYEAELTSQPEHLPSLQALESLYRSQNNQTKLTETRKRIVEVKRKLTPPTAPK